MVMLQYVVTKFSDFSTGKPSSD
ncbi:uncharacterized protein METZ01_LOCUS66516 [marine metagenome]|uniref:Uncharacterized protein n=1 Tax=marine metagenome TaxID=408172 RepID=A0A381TBX6_9ZZZZ